ncbi:MAG: DUF3617 family protein [Betaproteobacteria bacterium]
MRFPCPLHSSLLIFLAVGLSIPAAAQDYPKLKPGQWEVTTSNNRNGTATPSKITVCTDEAVQKQMMDMGKGMGKEMCSKFDLRRDGARFVGESVCKLGESTLTSHSVMTLQGDVSYHTVVNATYDPPLMGMKETTTTVDGKNVGPCRSDMKPGDVVTATGQKFNMMSMQNRPPVMPAPKAAPRPVPSSK